MLRNAYPIIPHSASKGVLSCVGRAEGREGHPLAVGRCRAAVVPEPRVVVRVALQMQRRAALTRRQLLTARGRPPVALAPQLQLQLITSQLTVRWQLRVALRARAWDPTEGGSGATVAHQHLNIAGWSQPPWQGGESIAAGRATRGPTKSY